MKNRPTTRPRVMLARFHLYNEGEFSPRKSSSLRKKYSLQQQNFVQLIFLYFPRHESMDCRHLLFFFYTFVDIAVRFFDTDLSLLIRFSMIEVRQKEVVTATSVRYSCKTSKTSKMNNNIVLVKRNQRLTVSKDFN